MTAISLGYRIVSMHEHVKSLIEQALPGAKVSLEGDGCHFQARVVAAQFDGLSTLARHRLVYQALSSLMKEDIHALQLTTLTPSE